MKKKIITFLSVCASMIFAAALWCIKPTQVMATGAPTVYVSATGSDENAGTQDAPYKTLDKALTAINNGDTIALQGTVAIDSWNAHNKTATITGGTLDVTAMTTAVHIKDAITFENMSWVVTSGASVYANGYEVTMGENVSWDNEITLFGGGHQTTVASTHLTVLSGHYVTIYGGTREGYVTGDTNLYVGGNVNEGIDVLNGPDRYKVYAGGYDNGISGCANLTFGENANARYIYGGQYYKSTQTGGASITITGGEVMSVYGGSKGSEFKGNTKIVITGGEITQVFGGSEEGKVTGNVDLRILGGEITRRVYGGCYNNWSLSWKSSHKVSGKINLEIGGTANISFNSSESDKGIFAFSRYGSELETDTQIVFTSESAYNAYKNKLGDDYSGASWNLSGAKAYHYYTYTANGNVLTQSCAYHSEHAATATLSVSGDCAYTGEEVTPAAFELSGDWEYDAPTLSYADNVEVGAASAFVGVGEVKAEQQFVVIGMPEVLGAGVRLSDPSGLRFQSKVPTEMVGLEGVTFGTLMIPKAVLGEAELTVETATVENIVQKTWATEIVKAEESTRYEEGYDYFNAVLTIPEAHYDKTIVARSYVCYNGQYYYSEAEERSIMQVASYAIRDGGTADILFNYVNVGMQGKDFSIVGNATVMEGLSLQLAVVNEQNCVAVWSSSNEKVLTVDKYGNVTAHREGTAIVTATIGNVEKTVEITVTTGWTGIW